MGAKILISGSGIAGLAAAKYLHRQGHSVTLIDTAPSFQKLGYALSVKAFGLKILDELGVRGDVERHSLLHRHANFYKSDGELLRTYSEEVNERATKGALVTIRSELHDSLYRATKELVPTRFGLHIAKLEPGDAATRAHVTLSNGESAEYDLVIVCEGMRSETRALVFPELEDHGMKPFGVVYAAARVRAAHDLDVHGLHTYFGSGRFISLMPLTPEEVLLQAAFLDPSAPTSPPHFSEAKLPEVFHSFAPQVTSLIAEVGAHGYVFFDSVAKIELPELNRGRVVFMGDAGHCTTFLSGMGASLGLLGAKVLADSLGRTADVPSAQSRYEEVLRPVISHFRHTADINVKTFLTENELKIAIRDSLLHLLPLSLLSLPWSWQFDVEERLLHGII